MEIMTFAIGIWSLVMGVNIDSTSLVLISFGWVSAGVVLTVIKVLRKP